MDLQFYEESLKNIIGLNDMDLNINELIFLALTYKK